MKSQNTFIDVKGISEAIDGAMRPINDVLEHVLLLDGIKVLEKKSEKLRFAADGQKTTKAKKTVRCVVSVMEEEEEQVGHQGMEQQYCTAVFEGDEDYTDLQVCLSDVLEEMQDVRDGGLEVCGTRIDVEWDFCSHWKFLAEFLGLNAEPQFFCLWCFCSKADIHNLDKPFGTWQIERTFEECCAMRGKKRPLPTVVAESRIRCSRSTFGKFSWTPCISSCGSLRRCTMALKKCRTIVEGKMSEFEEALKAGVLFTFREDSGRGKMLYTEHFALRVSTDHVSYLQPHDFHNTAKI